MSNVISMVGRLGQDAELKEVASTTVLEFSIANATGFGEKEVTGWFRCAMWGKRGEKIVNYLRKGSQVWVCGEFTPRPWTNKEGVEKLSLDINVTSLDFVGKKDATDAPKSDEPTYDRKEPVATNDDEEMPF